MHFPLRSILGIGALMIVAAACRGNTAPIERTTADRSAADDAPLVGDTVHVKLGGARRIDNGRLTIRFQERVSDDRCPANAICVRAGDARVRLRAQAGTTASEATMTAGSEAAPLIAGGYRLTVTELHPYPGLEAGNPLPGPWVVVRIARQ